MKSGLQRFRRQDVRETVTTSIFKISCHYSDRCCIILVRLRSSCFRLSEEYLKLLNSLPCSYWRFKIIFHGPFQSRLKLDKNKRSFHFCDHLRYTFDGKKTVWNRLCRENFCITVHSARTSYVTGHSTTVPCKTVPCTNVT